MLLFLLVYSCIVIIDCSYLISATLNYSRLLSSPTHLFRFRTFILSKEVLYCYIISIILYVNFIIYQCNIPLYQKTCLIYHRIGQNQPLTKIIASSTLYESGNVNNPKKNTIKLMIY
jgi:hypothetical protein